MVQLIGLLFLVECPNTYTSSYIIIINFLVQQNSTSAVRTAMTIRIALTVTPYVLITY